MRLLSTLVLGCSLVALGGCNGSGNAPDCSDTFTPCGGDIGGIWSFDFGCNVGTLSTMSCGNGTGISPTSAGGTYAFNADMSYTLSLTLNETGTVTYPSSCVTGASACTALNGESGSEGITTVTACNDDAEGDCVCSVTVTGILTDQGTYTTAGVDVTTMFDPHRHDRHPAGLLRRRLPAPHRGRRDGGRLRGCVHRLHEAVAPRRHCHDAGKSPVTRGRLMRGGSPPHVGVLRRTVARPTRTP